jgi:hypothetical protein
MDSIMVYFLSARKMSVFTFEDPGFVLKVVRVPEKMETRNAGRGHTSFTVRPLHHLQHIAQSNLIPWSHKKESLFKAVCLLFKGIKNLLF